jgi:ribose 5-phosphate isomerase B
VESGKVDLGIAFCGTGNGMAMTLNKHQGIRAGICWSKEIGQLIKQHNKANVLVLPARFISYETVVEITDAWLTEEFEGGRHQNRITKMPCR